MHMADTYQSRSWERSDCGERYTTAAYPSQHTLARALGVSEETIRRRTRELVAAGLLQVLRISIDGTKRKRCYYILLAPMKHSAMPARRKRVKQAPRGCVAHRKANPAPTKPQQRELSIVDQQREDLADIEQKHGRKEADALRKIIEMRRQHEMKSRSDAALLVGEIMETRGGVPIRLDNSGARELLVEACREIDGLVMAKAADLLKRGMSEAFEEALEMVKGMSDHKRESIGRLAGYFVNTVKAIHAKGSGHVVR
jgi:DNA-binding Lrp family transcriptional regulator